MSRPAVSATAPVGVFDSGVGGLSVLRHIRAQLPHESLLYFADSGFAPYGDKPEAVVAERALAVTECLLARGIKALVVACNTATVAAIARIRERHPDLPVVGVEPGLKPAAAISASKVVGVLATDRTLNGDKFLRLRDQISAASGARFVLQACSGLVELIEQGALTSSATEALLERCLASPLREGADTIVLGCTHYPFVSDAIRTVAARQGHPQITLIDTGDAVARQLARLLSDKHLLTSATAAGSLSAISSGSTDGLARAFHTLLGLEVAVSGAKGPSMQ